MNVYCRSSACLMTLDYIIISKTVTCQMHWSLWETKFYNVMYSFVYAQKILGQRTGLDSEQWWHLFAAMRSASQSVMMSTSQSSQPWHTHVNIWEPFKWSFVTTCKCPTYVAKWPFAIATLRELIRWLQMHKLYINLHKLHILYNS